jgi:ATP-dependent protease ClpP protease subunit
VKNISLRRVFAKANGAEAELRLYGDVGDDITANNVADALEECAGAKTLSIALKSYGGDVFEGTAIHALLSRFPGRKIVTVDGIAASAGSLIAMAGNRIRMPRSAMMMVHNASGLTVGTAEDMRQTAERLEKINSAMVSIYATRSGQSEPTVKAMLDKESWMSAAECLQLGFCDELLEDDQDDDRTQMRAVASVSPLLSRYKNLPPALRALAAGLKPAAPARRLPPPEPLFTSKENKVKKKALLAALGLPLTADASAALAAIQELRGYRTKYEALKKPGGERSPAGEKPQTFDGLTDEQLKAAATAGWGPDRLAFIAEQMKKGQSPIEVL